jgi:hypothetical protein
MTTKDQELLAEAYLTEIFGFGAKPEMIDIKQSITDPQTFVIVNKVLRTNPELKEYTKSCTNSKCILDKKKIPAICKILKRQYEYSMDNNVENTQDTDNIIDTHDALVSVYDPAEYQPTQGSRPYGNDPF